MFNNTGAVDAASTLFNLDDHVVLSVEGTGDSRSVLVEPLNPEAPCPECGVFSRRIQARPVHRVKDIACGGQGLEVMVKKRRLVCLEDACPKRTFVQVTDQIPLRSRLTTRLVGEIVEAAIHELRAITGIARAHRVSWPTVMRKLLVTEQIVLDVDQRLVRQLGVDEHRFRRVRFVLGTTGKMMRVEPWSIVFTDLSTGTILDVVDGRRGKAVTTWMAQRPASWKRNIEYVAMDMSAEFRKAIRDSLPEVRISVDHFHIIQRANQMINAVRRRRSHDLNDRRGKMIDPAYRYRKLLACNIEKLSNKQTDRLRDVLASDAELGVVYAIKEHVRDLLKTRDRDSFATAWEKLQASVKATSMHEAKSLFRTLTAWKTELETFCLTRLTNARSEAANLTAKNMKRIGRGYVNHENYRWRILLYTARLRPC
ncbi:ISL3 family transposase [Paeniglutamicibacter sp. Y32M11]|uniref:ISL3 family transposase n=1 Tax=Paeniglutamicibacter sp. Y32M11 TaxID=2853258 RepID=UPI001C527468|nr:ISL3 family transposase [Paeniglutamicibacter sp. Y32M11]QXQ11309.1 ISL3 family transposase [Paeniglutamicibacter sp. Y32M11]